MSTSGANALLENAVSCHKTGDVVGAIRGYELFLKKVPRHPGALNLLGLALFQTGKHDKALPHLKKALSLQPDLPGAEFNLAIILQAMQRYDEASSHFEKAIAANAFDFEAHYNLALVLVALKTLSAAAVHYEKAVALRPDHVAANFNFAKILLNTKDFEASIKHFRRALDGDPNLVDAYFGLAAALRELGRIAETVPVYEKLIAVAPDNAEAHCHLGAALHDIKRYAEALESHNRAITLRPDLAEAHSNLASSYYALAQYSNACSHYRRAFALKLPQHIALRAELNFAWALQILGLYEECDQIFNKIIAAHADTKYAFDAKQGKGTLYLATGNFTDGWPLYEYRFEAANDREERKPRWRGDKISGSLHVWGEQGLGDQILYASMIHDLRAHTSSIVLEVEPRLVDLFARSFPDTRVVALDSDLSREPIEAQIPIASLGRFLRPDWRSFSPRDAGYLTADPARTEQLRSVLAGDGLKVVGVSWRSINQKVGHNKSAKLTDFLEIFRLPGLRFVDLQYGDTASEREALAREHCIELSKVESVDNTNDIDGLAALISACDAVITVSNTTAHLAGALGRPTWVFVPFGFAQIWYWFSDRKESPWYPKVQVWHQNEGQTWHDLMLLAKDEIAARLNN